MNYNCVNILKWTEAQLKYTHDVSLQEATPQELHEALGEAIRYNWRVELWGEGYGLETFRRWGKTVNLGENHLRANKTISPITDRIYSFSIPTSETMYNPYLRSTTEMAVQQ